ncbi:MULTISPECIES: dTDP-4-dehydrorhamnose reductase [unclassified Thioalkalivibrio]|uniref:dTDP-4-dehydrorhamnose reductase n=1 Tax=unclassified Thioalkalivibrio TaxID=2621013 RepID=UPI00035C695B|nr:MULTISPECIES: dTDP-4-dehydrorhamnose reductase [unclassified Thioalkalivibrio]
MRILLLGSTGQVGWELQRALAPLGEVTALNRHGGEGLCGDLGQPEALAATVRRRAPDVIVNAAAYTAVDQAESDPERAEAINATAPAILAAEARALGAWLVHYSTDYVFDGTGQRPWTEADSAAPINVYGRTKWEGEEAIRQSGCRHLIFRTSWVYAARGRNFIRTMLRLASERDALRVIDDQFGGPTGAELIADISAVALMRCINEGKEGGLYHLAAAGETTWYAYARRVIATAREAGWPVRVADEAIEPVTTEAFPTPARRPHNSRLDTTRLQGTFGLRMPDWRVGVDRALDEILRCESLGRTS